MHLDPVTFELDTFAKRDVLFEETLHRNWEQLSFVRAPLGSKIFELYTTNFVNHAPIPNHLLFFCLLN